MEIGISLGSNLGDRLENLRRARDRLAALEGVKVAACSRVYETEPVDVRAAHRGKAFLNAVLIVESALTPRALAGALWKIEAAMGRVRETDRNAPRPIDLDIVYAGDETICEADLRVPHPRWTKRRFVVQPLAEVRPERVLPGETRRVNEVLDALPERPWARVFEEAW